MRNLELRTLTEKVELRAATPDSTSVGTAAGYAYKFNSVSQDLGGFVEVIAPGAGAASVATDDIAGLANHDQNLILGRSSSGTMKVSLDDVGLAYSIALPNTTIGNDWAVYLGRGDVTGSSFGFLNVSDTWEAADDGTVIRTLLDFSINDVGPVLFPAYLGATAALRSLAESRSLDIKTVERAASHGELAEIIVTKPAILSPVALQMRNYRNLSRKTA